MRSLLIAICAAAVFAIWASGTRAHNGTYGPVGLSGAATSAPVPGHKR